ncbi:hypothetical protein LCGC14_1030350 [marine sediment metagenome]|uniref:Uncharacterized protein n=1 Tax=marine sediment metagenome TaxID=412755 RepID=A0A0F9QCU6_9ZZZZ
MVSEMNERDKIIAEIAADERPILYTSRYDECRYCEESAEVSTKVQHAVDCIWIRSRVLAGKEPGPNAIVIADGLPQFDCAFELYVDKDDKTKPFVNED